mgnify:CR=1 FL=1
MRLEYFEMIDRVVGLDRDAGTIHAQANVPQESPVFEGHFPGYPIMPGVLLLETMAQAAGYLALARNGLAQMPFFAGSSKAKFRKFVVPATVMDVHAKLVHDGSGYAVFETRIEQGGRVADAEVMLRIMDFPAPDLREAMLKRAALIGLAAGTGAGVAP